MENEYMEYETFEMELKGVQREFAIIEAFTAEGKEYVAAAPIEGDAVSSEGCYLFRCVGSEGEECIEKLTDKEEYARVSEAYMGK